MSEKIQHIQCALPISTIEAMKKKAKTTRSSEALTKAVNAYVGIED